MAGERRWGPRETVKELYEEICKMVGSGWSTETSDYQKEKSLEYFLNGLRPKFLTIFWGEETEDLDVAFHKAYSKELYLDTKKGRKEIASVEAAELNAMSPKFIPESCKPAGKPVHVELNKRVQQNILEICSCYYSSNML